MPLAYICCEAVAEFYRWVAEMKTKAEHEGGCGPTHQFS